MSAIRVSGRKNSGINIAGFDVPSGNPVFCHCFNCFFLIDGSKDKKTISDVIKNSGTSCSTCRSKISPACLLIKRRCVDCQLFCKCSNCDSDPLLAAKIPIWTVNEYRACCHCGSACISSQCSDYEYCCRNCYLALQAVDIESEAEEEFMQIFEDGVASASNPVSNFSDAAVISMESNTVQVEEVNSRIVDDHRSRMKPETVEALMLCQSWVLFTKEFKRVPRSKYSFPSRGQSVISAVTNEEEQDYA